MVVTFGGKEYSFNGFVYPLNSINELVNDAYQKGKADAIDECKALFRKYILTKEIEALDGLFEQLKEQSNE